MRRAEKALKLYDEGKIPFDDLSPWLKKLVMRRGASTTED